MDAIVKELGLISVVAVLELGLAWRYEDDFAMFFAAFGGACDG